MDLLIGYAVYFFIFVATVALSIGLGLLPGIIAFRRRAYNRWFILALNVVFGATGFGWVAALIWACRGRVVEPQPGTRNNEAGIGLLLEDVRQLPFLPQQRAQPVIWPTGGSATPAQAADAIERLAALHSQGYITSEEFAKLKSELIGEL